MGSGLGGQLWGKLAEGHHAFLSPTLGVSCVSSFCISCLHSGESAEVLLALGTGMSNRPVGLPYPEPMQKASKDKGGLWDQPFVRDMLDSLGLDISAAREGAARPGETQSAFRILGRAQQCVSLRPKVTLGLMFTPKTQSSLTLPATGPIAAGIKTIHVASHVGSLL